MANSWLIDLGMNDERPDLIRKCNANFRKLYGDLVNIADGKVQREEDRASEAEQQITNATNIAINRIQQTFEAADAALHKRIDELEDLIGSLKVDPSDFAPPVGTYMYSTTDPSTVWTGTVWTKQSQGIYLVSQGTGYTIESFYGSNTHTITNSELPKIGGIVMNLARQSINADTYVKSITGYTNPFSNHEWSDGDMGYGTRDADEVGSRDGFEFRFGGGQSFDNRPYSKAVPLWKRTA